MTSSILIAYSTTDGHTRKICLRLKEVTEARGHSVTVKDIAPYDRIVIGASIRYGKHARHVHQFVNRNRALGS